MGSLKNKRILVTGGNGYLGSHLVNALKKAGADVFIIGRTKTSAKNEFVVDITDETELRSVIGEIKPRIIYHLAATLNRDRDFKNHDAVMNVNYTGTLNLLRALQDVSYENFIFTSSSEIYGSNRAPFREDQIPAPASPYSLSKAFAEMAIRTFSELNGKNYTILRLFNFFGPGMPENFFIPQLLHSLTHDTVFKMTKGEQARDFLYIQDVIRAMLLAGTKNVAKNDIFNVCSGHSVTLKKLVTEFQKRLNSNCKIDFGALSYRPNEVWNMVGNNKKIRTTLGFKPKYDLTEAINELINE